MDNLQQQIENLRTLQQSYDQLATTQASLAADVQAIKDAHILEFSFGGCVYDMPITDTAQAIIYANTNCVKFEDDDSMTFGHTSFGTDWSAVQEIVFLKMVEFVAGSISFFPNRSTLRYVNMPAFRSLIESYSCTMFSNATNLQEIHMASLKSLKVRDYYGSSEEVVFATNAGQLTVLDMPQLEELSTRGDLTSKGILTGLYSLPELNLPMLRSINTWHKIGWYSNHASILTGLTLIPELNLPLLEEIVINNATTQHNSHILCDLESCERIILPNLRASSIYTGGTSLILGGAYNVTYIEIGHTTDGVGSITDNIKLSIDPTNIYEDATKLAALNASIREHWFANLRDYTGGTAHTLTLMSDFVTHLEPETIQVATDKNWTIVTF